MLYDLNNKTLVSEVNDKEVIIKTEQLIASLKLKGLDFGVKKGRERKLFSKSIGVEDNSFERENDYKEIVYIEGNKAQNQLTLKVLLKKLLNLGVDVTVFCDVLDSSLIESLYIESIDVLIKEKVYVEPIDEKRKLIEQNEKQIAFFIKKAKKAHLAVEKFYIKNMNFDRLNNLQTETIKEIEEKIKKT